MTTSLSKLQ